MKDRNSVVVKVSVFHSCDPNSVPGGEEYHLHFNIDIFNFLWKSNGVETEGLILLFL